MFEPTFQMGISSSNGTSSAGYNICSQELGVDILFVNLALPILIGGPDIIDEVSLAEQNKRRIRESLDRSIQENAEIWRELSKR